jgi:hypothetical protein
MGDRIDLKSLTSTRASPVPASFSEISVFKPDWECRIFNSALGATEIGVASLLSPP